MSGVSRWLPEPPDLGPFRFRGGGPPPVRRVVRRIVKPAPDGPVYTGDSLTREPDGTYHRHHDPNLEGRPHPAAPTLEEG